MDLKKTIIKIDHKINYHAERGNADTVWLLQTCREYVEELKLMKDTEEQGLLLRLPCKLGDTVYKIWSCGKHGKSIAEFEVTRIRVDKHGIDFSILNPRGGICRFCDISDFGKTVFVTMAEAESALAEKEKAR